MSGRRAAKVQRDLSDQGLVEHLAGMQRKTSRPFLFLAGSSVIASNPPTGQRSPAETKRPGRDDEQPAGTYFASPRQKGRCQARRSRPPGWGSHDLKGPGSQTSLRARVGATSEVLEYPKTSFGGGATSFAKTLTENTPGVTRSDVVQSQSAHSPAFRQFGCSPRKPPRDH